MSDNNKKKNVKESILRAIDDGIVIDEDLSLEDEGLQRNYTLDSTRSESNTVIGLFLKVIGTIILIIGVIAGVIVGEPLGWVYGVLIFVCGMLCIGLGEAIRLLNHISQK